MNKIKIILLIVAVSVLMTACEDQEKNKLDNRVVDYWKYKIDRNFKEAYKFLSPGWKANESEIAFSARVNSGTVKWLDAKFKDKKCSEVYLCDVTVEIKYEYQFKGAMSNKIEMVSDINETWLLKNNRWYIVPNEMNIKQK